MTPAMTPLVTEPGAWGWKVDDGGGDVQDQRRAEERNGTGPAVR